MRSVVIQILNNEDNGQCVLEDEERIRTICVISGSGIATELTVIVFKLNGALTE
jgi:hypothetical protein